MKFTLCSLKHNWVRIYEKRQSYFLNVQVEDIGQTEFNICTRCGAVREEWCLASWQRLDKARADIVKDRIAKGKYFLDKDKNR